MESQAAKVASPAGNTKATIRSYALELGFDLVRVTSAQQFVQDRDIALERIEAGLMDGLPWYTSSRVNRGSNPRELLPEAQSVICLGLNYYHDDDDGQHRNAPVGRVARYARGRDYHRLMKRRMRQYVAGLSQRLGRSVAARWYVDDGPMLDRAAANRAGLGWFGKNTNILNPQFGSWVFLGQVITDLPLPPDPPLAKTCGNCVRCIPACPTGAITDAYTIDNSRCISHLTIENRGPIPRDLRPLMLDWVFGCDICQEVCPVNRRAEPTSEPDLQRRELASLDLIEILGLTDAEFLRRFQGTPIMRAKRVGLQRNACVALGNLKDRQAVVPLGRVLRDSEPLVQAHAAWALGQIGGNLARAILEQASHHTADDDVLEEISCALAAFDSHASMDCSGPDP